MELETSFLIEVDNFLNTCDLTALSPTNDIDINEKLPLSPPSQTTSSSDKPVTFRHKLYRKRRRAEREQLELEIEELKIKLAKEPRRLLSMSGWRMVTMCQLEARLVSELRHRQLHSAISVQAKLIKMYQGLLRSKFLSDNTLEIGNSNWNHYHRVELPQEPFDTEFYNACTRTFNAIYAQTDEIFNSCGLNSTDEMFGSYTCEKKDENDRSFFQFTDKRTFSSSFENAHNSFRRTLSLHQKKHQQQYGGMEDPDNTVAIKFRVTARLKTGFVGSVLLRLIHRRYQEVNRMVTVWRVFAEGEGEFAALHAAEIGWGILSPVPGVPESTMLRVCAHYIPMNLNNVVAPEQEQLTKQFSGMVVEASTSNAEEIACTFEKLLLNDAEEP